MYNVSSNYITAVRGTTRQDKITGTITFTDNTTQNLTERDFGEGSISIDWQCVDGEELKFGNAIIGELDVSIRTNASRYKFYGATISLTYSVLVGTDTWEDVPLGIYTVSEATKTGTLVTLVAYDNLQILDKEYGDTTIAGTPYQIFDEVCDQTGLEIGFTASTIADFPNADQTIQIDSTDGCNTYREAVKIVCQMIGAFAIVDRTGKLQVKQFHTTTDTTLSERHRYSSSIADYTCSYNALSVTGISGTYTVSGTEETGLSMVMDDAPAWDYGLEEVLTARAQTLMDYLETITYVPTDISMPEDPAIECGDRIALTVGSETIYTLITSVSWKFRNSMTLESVGQNPYFSTSNGATSSTNRQLTQQDNNNKLVLYDYTNTDDITITDTQKEEICSIRFSSTLATTVLFYASIIMDVNPSSSTTLSITTNASFYDSDNNLIPVTGTATVGGSMNVNIYYTLNGTELDYQPIEHYDDGTHTMVLFFPIAGITSQSVNTFKVSIESDGGSITINEHNLKAVLFGQNLVASIPWDGTIDVTEMLPLGLSNVGSAITLIQEITDTVTTGFPTVTTKEFSDAFTLGLMNIGSTITDTSASTLGISFGLSRTFLYWYFRTQYASQYTYNSAYVDISNADFRLNTNYNFSSVAGTIDTGALQILTIDESNFSSVTEIEVS